MNTLSRKALFLIACAILVGGLAVWGFSRTIRTALDAHSRASLLATLHTCENDGDLIACARPSIKKLLASASGTEVMQVLSDNVTASQCHFMGHIVGQELYRKYRNIEPTISECGNACFSACVHGGMGEAFMEEAGLDSANADFKHVSPDELRTIGKRLCTKDSSCHAVGHVFFQTYGDVHSATALCSGVSSDRSQRFCFVGVFMEYANELSSKSVWNNSFPLQRPPVESLASFCNQSSPDERRSCFAIFPELVIETLMASDVTMSLDAARAEARDMCKSIRDSQGRSLCAEGFGKYAYTLVLTDIPTAIRVCTQFLESAEQQSCVRGMVFRASHYNKTDTVLSFCAALPGSELILQCYLDTFAELFESGESIDQAKELCPADYTLCLRGAREFQRNRPDSSGSFGE